jgi:hypothetical protein
MQRRQQYTNENNINNGSTQAHKDNKQLQKKITENRVNVTDI